MCGKNKTVQMLPHSYPAQLNCEDKSLSVWPASAGDKTNPYVRDETNVQLRRSTGKIFARFKLFGLFVFFGELWTLKDFGNEDCVNQRIGKDQPT